MVEYTSSRLCFKADLIEPLKENDSFIVHTPNGTFKFTKADFYRVFSNVIETKSYQEGRLYNYKYPPKRAMQFLISGHLMPYKQSENSKHMVEYTSSRLCFKADLIEPLKENDSFIVHTPNGTFKFTKADFYRVFSNVIETKSYQEGRLYSYKYPPKRAMQFLISGHLIPYKQSEKCMSTKDLVGEEIRMKIKEIGILWRNSPNNPLIDVEVFTKWNNLIEEWIADKEMPLIIRKETTKRGQSFVHPCGREIIVSDNTVAIWLYSNVLKGTVLTLSQIKELLNQKELPMVFMVTKEIKAKAKYTKPLGRNPLFGWKLCHIQPVGFNTNASIEDLEISDIEDHFRKYVNPNNMFVLPKEIGYLGEIDVFIEEQKR